MAQGTALTFYDNPLYHHYEDQLVFTYTLDLSGNFPRHQTEDLLIGFRVFWNPLFEHGDQKPDQNEAQELQEAQICNNTAKNDAQAEFIGYPLGPPVINQFYEAERAGLYVFVAIGLLAFVVGFALRDQLHDQHLHMCSCIVYGKVVDPSFAVSHSAPHCSPHGQCFWHARSCPSSSISCCPYHSNGHTSDFSPYVMVT